MRRPLLYYANHNRPNHETNERYTQHLFNNVKVKIARPRSVHWRRPWRHLADSSSTILGSNWKGRLEEGRLPFISTLDSEIFICEPSVLSVNITYFWDLQIILNVSHGSQTNVGSTWSKFQIEIHEPKIQSTSSRKIFLSTLSVIISFIPNMTPDKTGSHRLCSHRTHEFYLKDRKDSLY